MSGLAHKTQQAVSRKPFSNCANACPSRSWALIRTMAASSSMIRCIATAWMSKSPSPVLALIARMTRRTSSRRTGRWCAIPLATTAWKPQKNWPSWLPSMTDLRLYVNYFQPVLKLIGKERVDGKTVKRYDQATTPFRRVLAEDCPRIAKAALMQQYL
jgi:hypothetical protein